MFCKKCGGKIDADSPFCAGCGAPVPEIEPEVIQEDLPAAEEIEETKPKKTKPTPNDLQQQKGDNKLVKIIVTVACCVLLAAVLLIVVLKSTKSDLFNDKPSNETVESTGGQTQEGETTQPVDYPSFAASDEEVIALRDEIIATCGDYQLTGAQMQLFYWFQVYMYYENNQQYIAMGYIPLDFKADLSKQACAEDPTISWEQFFIKSTFKLWHSYAAMNMLADKEGFELEADFLDKLKAETLLDAQGAGFSTVDEYVNNMLKAEVGPGVYAEDYWAYQQFVNRATSYYLHWYENATPDEAEMEEYYNAHEKELVEGGAGKEAGNLVDVRHILIMVKEDTPEAWKEAKTEADRIYKEWKDGGATEELFAELANKYSEDGGSKTNGGLYSNVPQGQMVEVFNNWIFDEARKTGDSAILEAKYQYMGYHIMYYVKSTEIWKTAVSQYILAEKAPAMLTECMTTYSIEKNEDLIKIGQPYL